MSNLTSARPTRSVPPFPAFINQRVARFQSDRFRADESALLPVLGLKPGPGDLDLKSNDYLALGRQPNVVEAQIQELRNSGSEQMMSAFFLNRESAQWEFEQGLADLLRSESSVLFQSGYQANTGLLQTIAEAGTPVYLDQMAHASLYQGVMAAGADMRPFRHNDVEHLRRQIRAYGPGVVCIDSVYSTNGSLAPICDVLEAAEDLDCALVVDESHSLGTHGPSGAGLVVELGLQDRVHFRTSSLAKAFCGRAGLVACSRRFAHYLRLASLPNIFSSCVLPHELAALSKTLELIRRDDWRRQRLHRSADRLRAGLDALGYNVSASASQIIALEAGTEEKMVQVVLALQARGVFGAAFFAPATAKNRACVRLSLHAGLEEPGLRRILTACADIRDEVGLEHWASTRRKCRSSQGSKASACACIHAVPDDRRPGVPRTSSEPARLVA
jgi:CAI-1 autoinducer synthase